MTRAFADPAAFSDALRHLPGADEAAAMAARARQAVLTKPLGSLGRLEDVAVQLAGWQGRECPQLGHVRTVIFAGNHGVAARGVSAYPAEVTAQMVANFEAGGAAINALAAANGMELVVVPLDLDRPTRDFTHAPAMDPEECLAALNAGAAAVEGDLDLLTIGEMGIANSTAAAALCAASLGGAVSGWTGPGTGLDGAGVAAKIAVIEQALAHHALGDDATPFEILCALGGREIAAMAGAVVAARRRRVPVVVDGFISCAALAPLLRAAPDIAAHCIAGHVSAEPGHAALLQALGLQPLLALGMRLGEGSGAALAVGIIRSAVAVHNGMATFAEAGIATAS
ncbi:nicotinate-nucleotide--dimethylbenzimidazole phosphoribosyltransferase [Sphingomonas sp. C3-2]|uniref:nicotinate-nucleotide--dimethylbenzimidazole phosphoribosyltransferase n=1 Tax=Sphingomonas sp. C3-2 TaxID=3062169 RepID=UPI00294B076D|nr:nicotinate-nucleotide--dimethylbenzimidazole phosphoribosyltransferase [Sphingomonas sp. C3-2]WOK35214.1 nicotinate-nucleotide--dimethylbenzimidazole phosphoribosyltransferase [Sphingomonas sp. C3-2]